MEELRTLRKQKGLKAKELGEMVGVSEVSITQYENGKRTPRRVTLERLAQVFDVSVDYLLGKENDHSEEWSREDLLNRLNAYSISELNEVAAYVRYLQYRRQREQAEDQQKEDTE